jgi:hypothetical protein
MLPIVKLCKKLGLAAVLGLLPFLSACDQLRNQIAAAIQAKTPEETLASVKLSLQEGKFSQALEQAEPLAKKSGDLQPAFALAAAQAYARMGRQDDALAMLGVALAGGAAEPTTLITHPDFESLRVDVRFLALLTHHGSRSASQPTAAPQAAAPPAAPSPAAAPAPTQAKAADTVSVEIGAGGVSARAGSVSVKLPP